ALAAIWFARNRVRSWVYQERDEDLIVERGVLIQRLSVVPYGRMQFVDVTAGPIDRVFRVATVKLHTAAAASDARIPGLERDEAARLRDRLAALGEAQAAGLGRIRREARRSRRAEHPRGRLGACQVLPTRCGTPQAPGQNAV